MCIPSVAAVVNARYWTAAAVRAIVGVWCVWNMVAFAFALVSIFLNSTRTFSVPDTLAYPAGVRAEGAWGLLMYLGLFAGVFASGWVVWRLAPALSRRVFPMPKRLCPECGYTFARSAEFCPECGLTFGHEPRARSHPPDPEQRERVNDSWFGVPSR